MAGTAKYRQRVSHVLLSACWQMLPALFNLLLSLLIVRMYGADMWGRLVWLFLLQFFSAGIYGFGSKDFLLKKFSEEPLHIRRHFQESLCSRAVLLIIPVCVLPFILHSAFLFR